MKSMQQEIKISQSGYTMRPVGYELFDKNDEPVTLTLLEKKCLECLAFNQNEIVFYADLSRYVWGKEVEMNTLRTLIWRLRKRLDLDIKNVNGMGYVLLS
jgi:DNA-binding response OmpR family regulator